MKKILTTLLLLMVVLSANAQSRRPIDPQHPMYIIHIDAWNYPDPQQIIDLIPDDVLGYHLVRVLHHVSDMVADLLYGHLYAVLTSECDLSLFRSDDPAEELRHGGFACAVLSYDGDLFTLSDGEIHVIKVIGTSVIEGNVLHFYKYFSRSDMLLQMRLVLIEV